VNSFVISAVREPLYSVQVLDELDDLDAEFNTHDATQAFAAGTNQTDVALLNDTNDDDDLASLEAEFD